MIRVTAAVEPPSFDSNVRIPGQNYLLSLNGKKANFTNRSYWRSVLLELHGLYGGICAYSCHFIPYDTGADTVEHFVPKDVDASVAYEWLNYRLVASRYNGRKGTHQDVIDPFLVKDDLFQIEFPSLMLNPNPIHHEDHGAFWDTVNRLDLNGERAIRSRLEYVAEYAKGNITLAYIQTHAPLIAREIQRQDLEETVGQIMGI